MNQSKNLSLHYLALAGVITLGTFLRFYNLELKPLWLDEVLTALLSLGHRYKDVPLEVVFPPSTLHNLFTLQTSVSCPEIAQAVATESTHPPLFFCLMHQWLNRVEPLAQPLSWKLRSLPAIVGVGAIAAIYVLNRMLFSRTAGLVGAALMAVSPFAVYLSQEARHYTLPMFFIILALLGLVYIQQTLHFRQQRPKLMVWLLWGIINSLGCYIHYFFILAFVAQLLTLMCWMYWRRRIVPKGSWVAVALVVLGVAVTYLPWLSVLLGSFGRKETDWLPKPETVAPLVQTLAGWLSMVIALPVEDQPLWIQITSVVLTIGFGIWVVKHSLGGLKQLWQQPETHIATFTLVGFTLFVLLQFGGIIYLLGKDITVAPRYNFVYYPAICALLAASFTVKELKVRKLNAEGSPELKVEASNQSLNQQPSNLQLATQLQPSAFLLFVSLLSCFFVVSNLVFLKPFHPEQVARTMSLDPSVPSMMVMGYHNFQDVALGLSFALAINQWHQENLPGIADVSFAFLHPEQSYQEVWQKLSQLPALSVPRLNLWVVAPGLRRKEYPQTLNITHQAHCTIDPTQHYRIGVPYQLYRCISAP